MGKVLHKKFHMLKFILKRMDFTLQQADHVRDE